MKAWHLLKFVWGLLWRQILQMLLIIFTIALLNYAGIITITLSVLLWVSLFKLWREVEEENKPLFMEWFWMIIRTTLLTVTFLYLFILLGGYGILGLAIILIGLAIWRIWSNWKLFDAVTTWGAERVKGKHHESFNIEKVMGEK